MMIVHGTVLPKNYVEPVSNRLIGICHALWAATHNPLYNAPLMPPSFRTRQKWTAISTAMPRGSPTQCST